MSQRMNRAQRILLITILIKMELLRRQRAQRIVRRGGFVAGLPKHTHTEADITDLSIGFGDLTGSIANAQTPNTLLLDGSRSMTGDFKLNYGKKARFETSNGFADPVDGSADIAWDDSLWCLILQSADASYKIGLETYEVYVDDTIWAVNDILTIRAKSTTGQIRMINAAGNFCFETSLTKKGIEVDTIDELTTGTGVTIEGILLKDSSLSGIVNTTLSGILATDQIDEKTAAAGVTVDGLLIKDSVIPDAGYPNAYLLDGSRGLTADMSFQGSLDITRLVRLEFEDDVGLFRRSVERLGVTKVPGTDPADLDCRELFTDDISEYTAATGVTIDSLLIKDGVIPDTGYPNAFLLDCTRDIIGNVLPDGNKTRDLGSSSKQWRDVYSQNVRLSGSLVCSSIIGSFGSTTIKPASGSSIYLKSYGGVVGLEVNSSGNVNIPRADDITLNAAKSVDCATNGGYFKPRRVSQAAQPTPDSGELLVWRDTDDDKTYLVYNDPDVAVRKVEMA